MLRKIVMLFPVLAFALPLVAMAGEPLHQVGKYDQVWPEQIGKPDQYWPEQIGKPGKVVPDPFDPCAPVCSNPCPVGEICTLPCEPINPCLEEEGGEDVIFDEEELLLEE